MASPRDEPRWIELIERCLRREADDPALEVELQQDLLETGVLDSMGWVSFLRALESATGVIELGVALTERRACIRSILDALQDVRSENPSVTFDLTNSDGTADLIHKSPVLLAGSGSGLGSRMVHAEEVDRAFGMPSGKLRQRAGIESLAYAAEGEDEVTLGLSAAQQALQRSSCGAAELDWLIATGETFREYPSLAAQLHSRLLARERCAALDVGGACLGLLHGLAVGQALIGCGQASTILVVTSDVHSRILTPQAVPGEFGGLFGDGASAFVLRSGSKTGNAGYRLGQFRFGCVGQYSGAIRIADCGGSKLDVHFDGEALSRAAITRLEKVIEDVELCSSIPRSSLAGLATHQPNPRLVTLLARQCGLPEEKFPPVARKFGNLGSSTSGVALDHILRSSATAGGMVKGPIFLASLGPGLLFGGGWLF